MQNVQELEENAQTAVVYFNSILEWLSKDPAHAIGTIAILLIVAIVASVRKRLGDNLIDFSDKTISHLSVVAIKLFSDYSYNLRYRKHLIFASSSKKISSP